MTELFNNRYKTHSLRLPEWDYSEPGSYFITICTHDRKSYFGEVIDGEMRLNDIGNIVRDIRYEIPYHLPHIKLDACIIMPNHVHGIITINEGNSVETHDHVSPPKNETCHVFAKNETRHVFTKNETRHGMSLQMENKFGTRNKKSISLVVNQFKGTVTREIRKHIPTFKRQSNYYEHVIRNDRDFERIHTYISNNPLKWKNDKCYE